jgi:hypothetical protein
MMKRVIRAYQRWQYRRTPRPKFIPTVTPIQKVWSNTDERLERDLYLANPNAFWLRPDRHEHKIPCWQIEGVWEVPPWIEWASNYATGLQNSGLSAYQQATLHQHASLSQYQYASNLMRPNLLHPYGSLYWQAIGKLFC